MISDREYEGHLRKLLLLKENLSKSIDPSVSCLRQMGELQVIFKFSLAVSVFYKLLLSSVLPTNWELVYEVLSHSREKQPEII